MGPTPTTPLAQTKKQPHDLAAADQQRRAHEPSRSPGRAHPARPTRRRAARARRGLRAQQAALAPRRPGQARQQAAALRPGAATHDDALMNQLNADAARESQAPAHDAAFYRQHPDLVPPQAVRAQMRQDDMPVEVIQMPDMPIEATLSRGEQAVLAEAGRDVIGVWRDAAKDAADKLFRDLLVQALRGHHPTFLDKAQDAFFDMLPGPAGKIRRSLEGMARAAAPKPEAQADAVVSAFIPEITARIEPLQAYVDAHLLQATKMAKDRDGRVSAEASDYHALWRAAPFHLPGPDATSIYARIGVELKARYYQTMAQATCEAGAGTPGLCMPEKLADPARWREDAERATGALQDGKVNFAQEKMGW